MLDTIHDTAERARELFINLEQSVALQSRVARFGYDQARLQEGVALLQLVDQLSAAYAEAYSKQLMASTAMRQARRAAQALYAHHVAEARRAFQQEREAVQTLGLHGRRKLAFREWLGQATGFYGRLLNKPDYLARMAAFSTGAAALQRGAHLVEKARAAKAEQDWCISQAREVSRRRQEALHALRSWLQTFAAFARLGLAATPEDLRALGLAHSPTAAKRAVTSGEEVILPSATLHNG